MSRVDGFVQERALHGIELLTVAPEPIPIQHRHLVRQLVDLQLLVFEFLIAGGELGVLIAYFSDFFG